MNFSISDELLQSLVNYLATKPFHEVYDLMMSVQSLEQLPEAEATDEVPKPQPKKTK